MCVARKTKWRWGLVLLRWLPLRWVLRGADAVGHAREMCCRVWRELTGDCAVGPSNARGAAHTGQIAKAVRWEAGMADTLLQSSL